MLKIKNLTLASDILLGPMAGVTDLPFRRICREYGCKTTTSEMISAKALHYQDKKTKHLLEKGEDETPFIVQIFGSDPLIMAESAKKIEDMGIADVLDINMGCPAPKIVNNGDGSALMKNEALAFDVARAVANAISLPVTVKFRLGWDEENMNYLSFGKAMEQAGANALTLHARTRTQFYAGQADWQCIKNLKETVSIPVIASGDIFCRDDILKVKSETGCDGVMVARGALGNPFIFSENEKEIQSDKNAVLDAAIRHLGYIVSCKGEYIGVREARKHMCWYIKGMHGAAQTKVLINGCETQRDMENALNTLRNE